jgi:hypothetical protein
MIAAVPPLQRMQPSVLSASVFIELEFSPVEIMIFHYFFFAS